MGWKDQFSSNDYTKRQQKYQDWLNLNVIYTPQFIINGTTEFAGYNETALYQKIADALKTGQSADFIIMVNNDSDSLIVNFKTDQVQKNSDLFVALVQKEAISKVVRGENKGSTLHHFSILEHLKLLN